MTLMRLLMPSAEEGGASRPPALSLLEGRPNLWLKKKGVVRLPRDDSAGRQRPYNKSPVHGQYIYDNDSELLLCGEKQKQKLIVNETIPSAASSAPNPAIASSPVTASHFGPSEVFGDAVISGAVTWLGTILAIVAAFQARAQRIGAEKIKASMLNERRRLTLHEVSVPLNRLQVVLRPMTSPSPNSLRGHKVDKIVDEALIECDTALNHLPVAGDDSVLRSAIASLQQMIADFQSISVDAEIAAAKGALRVTLNNLISECKRQIDDMAG